jgi:hypothetical protein
MTMPADADARLSSRAQELQPMPDPDSHAATPAASAASDLSQTFLDLINDTLKHHAHDEAARRVRANTGALRARNFRD